MAVYTSIEKDSLSSLLTNYDIGNLKNFEGIVEGVENTNYKITTSKNMFILTIFEKRVNENELPFFIELQKHLSSKKIRCPEPVADKNDQFINKINDKNCVIMSFLKGKKIKQPTEEHCQQIGLELAKIHQNTKDFSLTRENNLHFSHWQDIFEKCKKSPYANNQISNSGFSHGQIKIYSDLFEPIQKELNYLKKRWPQGLPRGIIHADVFKDNVFFENDKLTGLIDFYFACNDYYAYELAICINDWCFNLAKTFQIKKYNSMLKGYRQFRELSEKEIENMPILLRGAAMRFLLTRLHDQLYLQKDALVKPKDPMDYYYILNTHQLVQNHGSGPS